MIRNATCLLIFLFLLSCSVNTLNSQNLSWDEIELNIQEKFEGKIIEKNEVQTSDKLVVYIYTSEDQKISEQVDSLIDNSELKRSFNPVLLAAYLLVALSNTNMQSELAKNVPLILKYHNLEADNSLFSYLLSYYYLESNDYENFLKYLIDGNERMNINSYTKETKKIVLDYYFDKTKDRLFSYLMARNVVLSSFYPLLFEISEISNNKSSEFEKGELKKINEELYKMGLNMDKSSNTLLDKILSLKVQIKNFHKEENTDKLDGLKKKLDSIKNVSQKLNDQKGEKTFLKFLEDIYNKGEFTALSNLN